MELASIYVDDDNIQTIAIDEGKPIVDMEIDEEKPIDIEISLPDPIPKKKAKYISFFSQLFIFWKYPKVVWLIFGNAMCERFAFYGFKTILSLYLKEEIGFSEDNATAIVHAYIFIAYFTPLLGAFMADSKVGKYWTGLFMQVIYCFGQIFIFVTAIPGVTGSSPHAWGVLVGLLFVGIGSGGQKPCVSSFGGDQFDKSKTELLTSYFGLFYFSVNVGVMFSMILTPIARTQWGYWIAFSIPAALLFVATILFSVGKPWYVIIRPKEIIMWKFFKCLISASYHRIRFRMHQIKTIIRTGRYPDSQPFFCKAVEDAYSASFIHDTIRCLRIITVLFPIMIFWSLYDQSATRWVFTANRMNRRIGGYTIDADQIQVLNPIIIIFMVPFFDRVVYPIVRCTGFNFTPLRRMGIGFLFTASAFICSAIVDMAIDIEGPDTVHLAFQLPQIIILAAGETLVSVTGIEFAYSEAPVEMRSIMSSFYMIAIAMGNLIVLAVATIPTPKYPFKTSVELTVFSVLMVLAFGVFILISRKYKYAKSDKFTIQETNIEDSQSSESLSPPSVSPPSEATISPTSDRPCDAI